MSGHVLVLRPSPGAEATAGRAAALGLRVTTAPLFAIRPVAWEVPRADGFDALMLTSANAPRHAGRLPAEWLARPAYAVGEATAMAARAAGFGDIRTGQGDAQALLAMAHADGVTSMLHLAGREHRDVAEPAIHVERRVVYAADAVAALPEAAIRALAGGAVALLHSPRAARLFATLAGQHDGIAIAAISAAALNDAGPGWAAATVAARPDDAALLAAAARLCNDRWQEQDHA